MGLAFVANSQADTSEPDTILDVQLPTCPEPWIFAGELGCFYLNINENKVLEMVYNNHIHFWDKIK